MTTQEIADRMVALLKKRQFLQAAEELYSDDVTNVEPQGDPRESQGMDSVRGKQSWFDETFDVKSCKVEGPWVNDPCFIVKLTLKAVDKKSGKEAPMQEYALYSIHEGKINHVRFF